MSDLSLQDIGSTDHETEEDTRSENEIEKKTKVEKERYPTWFPY